MRDSPADEQTAVDVLAAFVRGHASRGSATPCRTGGTSLPTPQASGLDTRDPERAPADIEAAVRVILARRTDPPPGGVLGVPIVDLRNTQLSGADLRRPAPGFLQRYGIVAVDLSCADLRDANLANAAFSGVRLDHADLRGARLQTPRCRSRPHVSSTGSGT